MRGAFLYPIGIKEGRTRCGFELTTRGACRCHGRTTLSRVVVKKECSWATTAAPSPIAPPTRLTEPERTSPTAKMPATLDCSESGWEVGLFGLPFWHRTSAPV